MSITEQNSPFGAGGKNSAKRADKKSKKMNNKENKYEAPEIEIVEMVLENGIAFTIVHDGEFEMEELQDGGDLGTY